MRPSVEARSVLADAFRRFELAASRLSENHQTLQAKVENLERQLGDAHRRLRTVIEALDTGIAVAANDGRLLQVNPAFTRLGLGMPGTDVSSKELLDLVNAPAGSGTTRLRRETDRGVRDVAVTVVRVDDEENTRVLAVQDITEIRREEAEGGRRHRLEALGRMAAELAHEVRNPLGSIRLFAGMLEQELKGEPSHEIAEQILASTAGLESVVSNLLAFASPARGQRRDLDLAALTHEVCGQLTPACASRGVSLRLPEIDAPCPIQADPEGLRQVILNLVGNALAATGSGGTIRVRTRLEGDRAVLEVSDTGHGIAPQDLPRVFDPFFTRTPGGTGLGLSIVHQIVERHEGRIALDSRVGSGSKVTVTLPAFPPAEER